jgi:hypothetical protein
MRKIVIGTAICLVAVGLSAGTVAVAKKPKTIHVNGTLSMNSPTSALEGSTITISGKLSAAKNCGRNRTVEVQTTGQKTTTGPNGDSSASVSLAGYKAGSKAPVAVISVASIRKSGKGKKAKRIICNIAQSQLVFVEIG